MMSRGLHHVPREHGSHDAMFPQEHEAALTKLGNIVYCYTSCDAYWSNHDCVI